MTHPRTDVFTQIHKGIRAFMYDIAGSVQRTDFTNPDASREMLARVEHFMEMMDDHAAHEDELVFPLLSSFDADIASTLSAQHRDLHAAEAAVKACIADIRVASTTEAVIAAGQRLSRAFNAIVGIQSLHMNMEEEQAMPVFWRHVTDAEIVGMRERIIARVTPANFVEMNRWMLPALNESELVGVFRGLQAAPRGVRDVMFQLAAESLDAERWNRVRSIADVTLQPAS